MITIYFDGGAKPNPGIGYGSWEIKNDDALIQRGTWKSPFTSLPNNRAEYLTLWLAMCECVKRAPAHDRKIIIFSDSKLLIEQLHGRWKIRDTHLRKLHALILREISLHFLDAFFIWNSRDVNVEKFGH